MTHSREDWPRLAVYVASARQDAGFRTIRSFAASVGITERTLGALERGERVSRDTLLAVAKAVGWTPDSPGKILAGGEPVMVAGQRAAPPTHENAALQAILDDDRLPRDVRLGMVALAEAMRRRSDTERDGRSALGRAR
jgi:transcriptional regulator with XRE-family HTH domain